MRARSTAPVLAGLVVTLAVVLAGCGSDGAAATPTPSSTTATVDASVAACTSYVGESASPRQVVKSGSEAPILGPAVALVLINFRSIAAGAALPADPQLGEAFTEVVAAVDDLSTQLSDGLPAGADSKTTPVKVDPARLGKALDATDALCTARGVAPKAG